MEDNNRKLDHKGREVFLQHDWDFCSRVWYKDIRERVYFLKDENGNFVETPYTHWYMDTAIEKLDKIKKNRHLITESLILEYRWAIREGYNHMLDPDLKNQYDQPRNRNTIAGVRLYIDRIERASNKEMESLNNEE